MKRLSRYRRAQFLVVAIIMTLTSLASFPMFDWHRIELDNYEIRCIDRNQATKPGIEVVTPCGTYFWPTDPFGCEEKKRAAIGKLEMYRAHSEDGYVSLRVGKVVFLSYLTSAIIGYLGLFGMAVYVLVFVLWLMRFAFANSKQQTNTEVPKFWVRQFLVAIISYVIYCYVLMIFGNRAEVVRLGMQLAVILTSVWAVWLTWRITNSLNDTD